MTMPKSPIMGETAMSKSPDQEAKESLVSTMAKDILLEKEKEITSSPPLERTIVQTGVDFDRRCEEASVKERYHIMAPCHGIWYHTSNKFRRGNSQTI